MAENQAKQVEARRRRPNRTGVVVSNKMEKSVVVKVERMVTHPIYKRTMRRSTKLMAHDETNQCGIGDQVVIEESRPLSRKKRWVVKKVLRRQA